MPSTIGWLDTTVEQQRVAREMVSLFMISESRDELGIGQIRDVLSNWMFPGTSTLQTRARYFVLIPWCDAVAARRAHRRGRDLDELVREVQFEMIETMRRDHPGAEGLIGRQAGRALKQLPRDVYWSGLLTFGIRRTDSTIPLDPSPSEGEATEMTTRQITPWDPDVPPVPDGFPAVVPGGLDVTAGEAQWLHERMRTDYEDTYLARLLTLDPALVSETAAPWEVEAGTPFASVHHARHFSLAVEGASLLYNLLVAERYADHPDLNRLDGDALQDRYRERLTQWAGRAAGAMAPGAWDLEDFRAEVITRNGRISHRTWDFVTDWVHLLRREGPASVADSPEARRLITARESRKGAKSRLTTTSKTLEVWGGDSGSGALLFRWSTVQRLLLDINLGRGTQEVPHADA